MSMSLSVLQGAVNTRHIETLLLLTNIVVIIKYDCYIINKCVKSFDVDTTEYVFTYNCDTFGIGYFSSLCVHFLYYMESMFTKFANFGYK